MKPEACPQCVRECGLCDYHANTDPAPPPRSDPDWFSNQSRADRKLLLAYMHQARLVTPSMTTLGPVLFDGLLAWLEERHEALRSSEEP